MRNLIVIVIAAFALSSCVALPITFGIAQVGMGFSNGDPSVAPDIECVGVACDNDRGDKPAMEPAMQDDPDIPDVPDAPDRPDVPDRGDKPGWGHGDRNHDHKGPPGQNK